MRARVPVRDEFGNRTGKSAYEVLIIPDDFTKFWAISPDLELLYEDLDNFVDQCPEGNLSPLVCQYAEATIDYDFKVDIHRWRTPLETYKERTGDCKDVSFLVANALNRYRLDEVGVALGYLNDDAHAWVYAREGRYSWLLEPTGNGKTCFSFPLSGSIPSCGRVVRVPGKWRYRGLAYITPYGEYFAKVI